MTYVLLSVAVLGALVVLTWRTVRGLGARVLGMTSLVLIVLTVVFDNVIVGTGIVDYNDALIAGVRMPIAPIEDLAYALGAVLVVPALWTWFARLAPAGAEAGGAEAGVAEAGRAEAGGAEAGVADAGEEAGQ